MKLEGEAATGDKAEIPEGTLYGGDVIQTVGVVTQRYDESKGGVYCVEVGKAGSGGLQFTVQAPADVTVDASSTGSSNASAIGLLNVQTGALVEHEITTVIGTDKTTLTYTDLPAGTYKVISPENAELNRSARIHGLTVAVKSAETEPPVTPPQKPETPSGNGTTYTFDATTDVTPGTDKDAIPAGTTYADGFIKVVGTVTQRVKADTGAVTSTEVAKNGTGAYEFTITGTADVSFVTSSTGGSNTSTIALVDGSGNAVSNKEGISEVTGTGKQTLTYENLPAGNYQILSPQSSYGRGARVYTITITEYPVIVTTEYSFDATTDVTPGVDKDAIPAGTTYADGFIKVVGTVTQRVKADTGAVSSTEVGKNGTGAYEFTITGTADVSFVTSSTGGSNTSTIALVDGSGNAVSNKEGISEVTGTGKQTLTYENLPAGTYQILSPQSSYGRGARVYAINITETSGGSRPARKAWADVAAPVIGEITSQNGKITVPFTMVIGYDGADAVTVKLLDETGAEADWETYGNTGTSGTVVFEPNASGSYKIQIAASRSGETDKVVTQETPVSFVLPLKAPVISSATSTGGGKVSVVWSAVPEAERYEVFCDGTLAGTTEELSYEVTGLTVGTEYAFTVTAVRGEDASDPSAAVTATVTEDAQRVWGFTRYGSSTNDSNNGYVGDLNADGAVTVYSEGGKGKIVPNSTDGVAFYYTAIPAEYNFTLRATVTVDSWTLSNGQEGFGLMAADRLGPNGDSAAFWNNQYMAIATKVEYTTDSGKYSMKLGLGAMAKTGLTPANLPTGAEMPAGFSSVTTTLDHTPEALGNGAGTYNIIGNATASVPGTIAEKTTFVLELQKNNTGYFVTYYDAAGNVITRVKDYDPGALTRLDADNVYAGFFASRNARATFSDVTLTTILASEDAPGEERPVTKIEPTIAITSATTANSESYTAYLYSNVAGTAVLKKDGEIVAENIAITGGVRQEVPVTLAQGENKLEVTFTPDPDQDLGEFTELTSADPISASLTVSYQAAWADQNNLYIAPSGTPEGKGTKASPLDIYTAIRNVQPGQTIVMMEGTYLLDAPVKIEQGIDGTADKPIRMIADPEAASRPVIDFQKKVTGITHGGDYWYFQGFDVTNSANGQKGFQVSGHYNTLDGINTYNNGNTGIQISRYSSSDPRSEWPSNNLILNCTSHNNADAGYEDADGFAAKLTCGEGNVFDGCVAYNNADDGWDLYAKVETGPIGAVTIRNCVAYGNGYLEDGTNAGNGNGFKMGGESLSGKHKLINSYAFFNKAKGIDSNSCPDIIVENATSYNNESYNVAFYTNNAANTDFSATGIVSFKDASIKSGLSTGENLKPKGTQDTAKYLGDTNYYWDGTASKNASGAAITADSFVSLEFKGVNRNADGTIDLQGFLELKDSTGSGAAPGGTGSDKPEIDPDKEPIDYPFTQGGGQTVTQGESAAFKTGADFGKYEKVIINGKLLMNANITGNASGTTLTLSKTFTESLEPGTYTLEIHYEDGVAKTTFQVKAAPATDPTTRPTRPNTGGNAGTGDEFPMSALIVVMTLALIGIAVLVLSNRKFKK